MFSKKILMIVGMVVLITVNIIFLSVYSKHRYPDSGPGRIAISLTAPFQEVVTHSIRLVKGIWSHYFFLVSVAKENENLKKSLRHISEKNKQLHEIELSNSRLRKLLNFKKTMTEQILAAEVIGRDPSPWFKAIVIDKGKSDGLEKGLPVVIPEGIAGQIVNVSHHYSKVLLLIDQNSAVDALVHRTRARGVVKGMSDGQCIFKYALRKHDIRVGDALVASGLDGVFPKGLPIGQVSEVIKHKSGIFQEVTVTPYVDFEKLEEVLVLLNPPQGRQAELRSGVRDQ